MDESPQAVVEPELSPAVEQPRSNEDALRSRIDAEDVKNATLLDDALKNGLVELTDDMDPKLWAAAFKGRLARAESDGGPAPHAVEPGTGESDEVTNRDQEILDSYHQRRESFQAEHPDFNDVIGRMELSPAVAPGVELALLHLGPAVAYSVASDPEFIAELNGLPPAAAVARVGAKAAQITQQGAAYDATARDFLGAEISQQHYAEYQRRAQQAVKACGPYRRGNEHC